MNLPKNSLGQKGESQAKKFLQSNGYLFIVQNFSVKFGEIDLIFKDGDQLVFVEVKARKSNKMGRPEEAVTPRKLQKIYRVAEVFMLTHPNLPQSGRVEVIAISSGKITHFKL